MIDVIDVAITALNVPTGRASLLKKSNTTSRLIQDQQ
jgi:hypothetical protein